MSCELFMDKNMDFEFDKIFKEYYRKKIFYIITSFVDECKVYLDINIFYILTFIDYCKESVKFNDEKGAFLF